MLEVRVRHHRGVDNPADREREAAAVAEAAVVLAGGALDPFTRTLIAMMSRGQLTGDAAAAALIARFVGPTPRRTIDHLDRAATATRDVDDPRASHLDLRSS
jgi:hypothetical protein